MNTLITIAAAADLIGKGTPLALAGTEAGLAQLPAGNWIGGTTPYFMLATGGTVVDDSHVFATDLSTLGDVRVAYYGPTELAHISGHAPENGFALTIIPAGSQAHTSFAAEAANFPDAFLKPTVGWIAGVHLTDLGTVKPKVFDGRTATAHDEGAIVANVTLPGDKLAQVEIVNLFEPDGQDTLRFKTTSFDVSECEVNGETRHFATYLRERGTDHGKLPLVGDYAGAHINVSLQSIGEDGVVHLYAPVFPGVDYHFAKPVGDYAEAFRAKLATADHEGVALGCNCILNFLFGELEGKTIGGMAGPVTFGEIAYQLLNQTMVTVRIM